MRLIKHPQIKLLFSTIKNFDVISIGPYANRATKHLNTLLNYRPTILTIQQEALIFEPSLFPVDPTKPPILQLQQKNHTFSEVQRGVKVVEIEAEKGLVKLSNGAKYGYRYLVYSGENRDWKRIQQKEEKDVTTDYEYENAHEMFWRKGGRAIFAIPKGLHFGYQNYFMMLLKSKMDRNRSKNDFGNQEAEIIIVNEGQRLSPNEKFNRTLEFFHKNKGISMINNAKYKLVDNQKTIKIQYTDYSAGKQNKQQKLIDFNCFFRYLPMKVPAVLQNSKIDPFNTDPSTLSHRKYDNIYIIGNCFQNRLFTLAAVDKMTQTVGRNLYFDCIGVSKRAIYDGYTAWNLWVSQNQCVGGKSKDGDKIDNFKVSDSKWKRKLSGFVQKNIWPSQVDMLINMQPLSYPLSQKSSMRTSSESTGEKVKNGSK